MKTRTLTALLLLVLTLAACNKSTDASLADDSPSSATNSSKLSGTLWKAKLGKEESEKGKSKDGMEKLADGMGDAMMSMMSMELEFPTESTFKMSMMGVPIEGEVKRSGRTLTLTPEKIMGLTKEEAAKLGNKPTDDRPMVLELTADGKSLKMKPESKDAGEVVFERSAKSSNSEKLLVPSASMTDVEKSLIGSWTGTYEAPKLTGKESDSDKQQIKAMEMMSGKIKLDLNADSSFSLVMGMEIKGKWKVENEKIALRPTAIAGMNVPEDDKSNSKPNYVTISKDRKVLTMIGENDAMGKVTFKK